MAVEIIKDVVYGEGKVGYAEGAGAITAMPLMLDAYLPERRGTRARPCLLLAFGGAFHRGSKEADSFSDGVGTSTAMAEYCRHFAEMGLPSFSVSYRLAQTDPAPIASPVLTRPEGVSLGRASVVRDMLGLGPITPLAMARAMEAAFDDVATAARFVQANGERFGIDPTRMAIGGFSAGGRCAMYTAYAKRVPVAYPPLLYFSGGRDLEQVLATTPGMISAFEEAGARINARRIADTTHFYPSHTRTDGGGTVLEEMTRALSAWGCLPGA